MNFQFLSDNKNAVYEIEAQREENGIIYADVKMTFEEPTVPEIVRLSFEMPMIDCYSVWSPQARYDRSLKVRWWRSLTESRLASNMPLHQLVSIGGRNRMAMALSDAKTPMTLGTGVIEETGIIYSEITFFTVKIAPIKEYKATLRIDMRDTPYYDSIYDIVEWWEKDCGYTPAYVPDAARLPVNSLWYSYHQNIDVEDIVKECELSKALGMDTVIVDDGWQTDDNSRGYAYCGDWKVAQKKIPDMKEFVDRVHGTGMKFMLWYSVPFVGLYSQNYERFKDMLLDQSGNEKNFFALDPRYKEVRDFLVSTYKNAVTDWGLDGLKLDFIDSFFLKGNSLEYDPRRDYSSLEDAIDVLMTEVKDTLTAINPEIMIEFRQSYVGPAIRKYGNMLRVTDCPADAIRNRNDSVNLRFTSGRTAVHSDMIMWNYDDKVEAAAMQFVSVLFTVPQISMKIAKLNEEHKKMLSFYLSFWKKNRELLLDGKILAANPESLYSLVCAQRDGDVIFVSYTDTVIPCADCNKVVAVNASRSKNLIIKGATGKSYKVLNCCGEQVNNGDFISGEICEIAVPHCGMIVIE